MSFYLGFIKSENAAALENYLRKHRHQLNLNKILDAIVYHECIKCLEVFIQVVPNLTFSLRDQVNKCVNWNKVAILKRLIEAYSPDTTFVTPNGSTLIMIASLIGYVEILRILLGYQKENINARNKSGMSAITFAVKNQKKEVLIELLKQPELNVNNANYSGWNALMNACECENIEVVSLLLDDPRIDINATTEHGITAPMTLRNDNPAILAPFFSHPDFKRNLQCKAGFSLLHHCVERGLRKCVRFILADPKIDVNQRCRHLNRTALMNLCRRSDVELDVLQMFLNRKDLQYEMYDREGRTVMHYCINHRQYLVINILVTDERIPEQIRKGFRDTCYSIASLTNNKLLLSLLQEKTRSHSVREVSSIRVELPGTPMILEKAPPHLCGLPRNNDNSLFYFSLFSSTKK